MDNKSYQKNYRKSKQKAGWKYFSVIVPYDFHKELKKFYLNWKINNIDKEKEVINEKN